MPSTTVTAASPLVLALLLAPLLGSTSGYKPESALAIVEKIKALATIPASKLNVILFTAFMSPIIQFFLKLAETTGVLFDSVIIPMKALIDSGGQFILALVGGAAGIISAGAQSTAQSLLVGVWSSLGPFNYALAIASVLAGFWILIQFLQEPETPDWIGGFVSAMPDLPTGYFGTQEEEE